MTAARKSLHSEIVDGGNFIKYILFFACWLGFAPFQNALGAESGAETSDKEIILASNSIGSLVDLSLEQLLSIPISIAGNKAISNREAPAVTSVITRQEILNIGARSLQDALTVLVPGYSASAFADVNTFMVRGFGASSGKALVMVDGLEVTERILAATYLGNNYNLDNVDHIEVIRGPGSANYGFSAEVTVINVVTRSASENSAYAAFTNSQMSDTYSYRGITLGYLKEIGDLKNSFSFTGMPGNGTQANIIEPFNGQTVSTLGLNQLNLFNLNFQLEYKGLSFKSFINQYRTTTFYNDLGVPPDPYFVGNGMERNFDQAIYELKYDYELSRSFKIIPRILFKREAPYNNDIFLVDPSCPGGICDRRAFHKVADTAIAEIGSSWDVTDTFNLMSGLSATKSKYSLGEPGTQYEVRTFETGGRSEPWLIYNYAIYTQGSWYTPYVNVTLGARYDWSAAFEPAFVPRIVLTKALGPFHIKALASQGYRTPTPNQLDIATGAKLEPEKATTLETELGYQFTSNFWASVNLFDINVNNPLVYVSPEVSGGQAIFNFGKQGTRGIEAQTLFKSKTLDVLGNYAFYTVPDSINAAAFVVPGEPSVLLGAPKHIVNLVTTYKPLAKLFIVPSLQFLSQRYFISQTDFLPDRLGAVTYFNLHVRYEDFLVKGLEITLGIRDLFNRGTIYPQEQDTFYTVIPGPSRSYLTRVSYTIPF